jgi:hypothetical protein
MAIVSLRIVDLREWAQSHLLKDAFCAVH